MVNPSNQLLFFFTLVPLSLHPSITNLFVRKLRSTFDDEKKTGKKDHKLTEGKEREKSKSERKKMMQELRNFR